MAASGTAPACFVVMPIRKEGTPEHTHYRAFYEEILRPILVAQGYEVVRADEVAKSGAITKDIVLRLSTAELVVADLTDLNPNVFYEVGVRHSLRGDGTIMILDETRTKDIPFDLGAYRVIRFKGELAGYKKLRQELTTFIQSANAGSVDSRDNPVHDWLPALPMNVIEAAAESVEGELRASLAEAQQTIRDYEDIYGPRGGGDASELSPLSTVLQALSEAQDGNLPSDLLRAAEEATRKRDAQEFLTVVRRVLEQGVMPLPARSFLLLTGLAQSFEMDAVRSALYDHALRLYPSNQELRNAQLAFFAHSDQPAIRERARRELQQEIGITIENGVIRPPSDMGLEKLMLFGVFMDAYHEDALHEKALEITTALVDAFPERTVLARNHARALKENELVAESLEWYQHANQCPDADDVSAVWLGSTYHNERRYVDAVEAYLVACLRDPDDGMNFAHVADDIAFAIREEIRTGTADSVRQLPEGVAENEVQLAIVAGLSCRTIRHEAVERFRRAAVRAEIEIPAVAVARGDASQLDSDLSDFAAPLTVRQRVEFARMLYEQFRSEATDPGRRGAPMRKVQASGAKEVAPADAVNRGSETVTDS